MSTMKLAGRGRSRFVMFTAAGLGILAALAGTVYLLSPATGQLPAPAPAGSHTNHARPAATAVPAPSPPVMPTAAPAGITWELVGQSAVPVSRTDGPANVAGCKASGYTHTPVGALIAAAQISARAGFSAGRACWEPALTSQFTASGDRDALLRLLNDAYAAGQKPAAPGELAQISGFRYISYTGDTAIIGLVRRTPQGSHAQTTLTVLWDGGDWKLAAPAGGQWPGITTPLANLAGVTAWGAS